MDITYKNTDEKYELEFSNIDDLINFTNSVDRFENKVKKYWIFQVNYLENGILIDYFINQVSFQSGIAVGNVVARPTIFKEIFLPDVGTIEINKI